MTNLAFPCPGEHKVINFLGVLGNKQVFIVKSESIGTICKGPRPVLRSGSVIASDLVTPCCDPLHKKGIDIMPHSQLQTGILDGWL